MDYWNKTKRIISILFAVALIFILLTDSADARRKRRYNVQKNRQEAITILRAESEELANLAGLKPITQDSVSEDLQLRMKEASEILSDELIPGEDEEGEIIEELEQEDDIVVSLDDFKSLWLDFVSTGDDGSGALTFGGVPRFDIMQNIMSLLGTPYRFGGNSLAGIDCSAFTQFIYRETAKIMLPRTAREQINAGQKVTRKNLQFGDLVFFNTRRKVRVSHVGIYLGDDLFAHASSRSGVTIGSLKSTYYNKRFIGGSRLTPKHIERYSIHE